jgi:hypothetical protein
VIRTIQLGVKAHLESLGCPLPVGYGPDSKQSLTDSRIVFERDRDGGDELGPAKKLKANPRMVFVRALGVVVRIYATSNLDGANVYDHERVADQAADLFLVSLREVVAQQRTLWRVASAKYLNADELAIAGIINWPGVVYEYRLSVDRGVFDRTWVDEAGVGGDARPEVELGPDGVELATTTQATGADGVIEDVCLPAP